ncbi:hypothetical protein BDF19DRAFT_423070 [Syncephalis fuscata]|nr:hypothetical protein BDF19DRAFT_423070 [Syncephalis fuscata]
MSPAKRKDGLHAERIHEINEALGRRDLERLRELAVTGPGFVNNGLRRLVWPLLLSPINDQPINKDLFMMHKNKSLPPHRDARQIELDVNRSSNYCTAATRQGVKRGKRHQLNKVALYVLESDANLHYYQGFHDVCSVFLNVLGDSSAKDATLTVAHAMASNLEPVMDQLQLLYPLIDFIDSELAKFLIASETPVYFAVGWVLSWFSHHVSHLDQAARLFDLFISTNPIMPLYVAAQVVAAQRDELLAGECEFTVVHHRLSNMPTKLLTNELLNKAVLLYQQFPLSHLQRKANHFLDPQSAARQFFIKDAADIKQHELSPSLSFIQNIQSISSSNQTSTTIGGPVGRTSSSKQSTALPRLLARDTPIETVINDQSTVVAEPYNTYVIEFDVDSEVSSSDALSNFRGQLTAANITYTERYVYNTALKGISLQTTNDQYRQLSSLGLVKKIWPVHVAVSSPAVVVANSQVNQLSLVHQMTGVTKVQTNLKLNGSGIKVGIVDSGVDYRHPALGGCFGAGCRVAYGYDFVGDKFDDTSIPVADNDPLDTCSGHGTHVAGIIGANSAVVTGVAPNVIFGAYRITSCSGQTFSDITVAGMERAYADGMDIINLSMISENPWPTFTTALAAERITALGVHVVGAAGNSGLLGLWLESAPGAAPSAMSAASSESSKYMASVFTASTDPDRVVEYVAVTAGLPLNFTEVGVGIARGNYPANDTSSDSACTPLTGNYSNIIVVAKRGNCSFDTKALNAQNAGARLIVVYDTSEIATPPAIDDPSVTIPLITIPNSDGLALLANINANGTAVNITFASEPRLTDNPESDSISTFSSWGPSPYLDFKPDITAPGGKIYSTWLTNAGSYATLSGTSMSSPYVAGSIALYLQYKGKAQSTIAKVRQAFQNAARPILNTKGDKLYASTARQGSGLVDVYQALAGYTRVSPARLALNDTEHAGTTNLFDYPSTSKSVRSLESDGSAAEQPSLSNYTAAVLYFPPIVILAPGSSYTVDLTIVPPIMLPAAERWIYSGYIIVDPKPFPSILIPSGVVTENAVHVPYMGMKGNMHDILPLQAKANYVKLMNLRDWQEVPAGQKGTYTFTYSDFPMMYLHIEFPIRQIYVYLYDAATKTKIGTLPDATTTDYARNDRQLFPVAYVVWYGSIESAINGSISQVKSGEYYLRLAALRPYGDVKNDADYDYWQSPNIIVKRS